MHAVLVCILLWHIVAGQTHAKQLHLNKFTLCQIVPAMQNSSTSAKLGCENTRSS